jgi:hypothetical protein
MGAGIRPQYWHSKPDGNQPERQQAQYRLQQQQGSGWAERSLYNRPKQQCRKKNEINQFFRVLEKIARIFQLVVQHPTQCYQKEIWQYKLDDGHIWRSLMPGPNL